jgi:hypothetical protein
MPKISVSEANNLLLPTVKSAMGGLAALLTLQAKGSSILAEIGLNMDPGEVTIAAAAGQSAGIVLPVRHAPRVFVGYGLNPMGTLAAWTALGSDALRDNANVLDDTIAPIGSFYLGHTVAAGAVTAAKIWYKTAAATWTDLTL